MATTVNVHAAKTHLSRLIDRAAAGEDIIIARSGKPVARLAPLRSAPPARPFGVLRGKIRVASDFDAPLPNSEEPARLDLRDADRAAAAEEAVRLLLDSHVFLWWLRGDRRLSQDARRAVAAPASEVFVSAVSIWEIAIKLSIGRLRWLADVPLEASIGVAGFEELAVTATHAAAVRDLGRHHGDPFDRLLAAQAIGEGLAVVTADPAFESYGVRVLAAG